MNGIWWWFLGTLLINAVLVSVSVVLDRRAKPASEREWTRWILVRGSVFAASGILVGFWLGVAVCRL